jgi:hypothetical protein
MLTQQTDGDIARTLTSDNSGALIKLGETPWNNRASTESLPPHQMGMVIQTPLNGAGEDSCLRHNWRETEPGIADPRQEPLHLFLIGSFNDASAAAWVT